MSNAPSAAIRHGRSSLTRFDLEDRFIEFAVQVCDLAQRLPSTPVGKHVASQLIRSATSPLANYGEAQGAESRRDFVHKLRVCLKELRETSTWLKFSLRMKLCGPEAAAAVTRECDELLAITVASIKTASGRNRRM